MIELEAIEAYSAAAQKPHHGFPQAGDVRYTRFQTPRAGFLVPALAPRFKIKRTDKVFTIGSCFTSTFETALKDYGCHVPVADFDVPKTEFNMNGRNLLVDYVPGTLRQKILAAYDQEMLHPEAGIEEDNGNFSDLFLHVQAPPVSRERLFERRNEIAQLYKHVLSSDVVLITLGYAECWYDLHYGCYLNKPPSFFELRKNPMRYVFRRMEYQDCFEALGQAIKCLAKQNKRILMMIAPMPFGESFSPEDIVMASSYSKSVLRCAVQKIWETFPQVDYFPCFEVGETFGIAGYDDDHMHLSQQAHDVILDYFCKTYFEEQ